MDMAAGMLGGTLSDACVAGVEASVPLPERGWWELDNACYNIYFPCMASNLQDEIKQTRPFPSRSAEALLSIMRTATLLEHEQNEALRPHGITSTQYNVLRILQGAGKEGLCGREIAERLISKVPDVSRLLDRMDECELISRERDPNDRRHVTARIAPKGRRLVTDSTPALQAVERKRMKQLGAGAVASLVSTLATIRGSG